MVVLILIFLAAVGEASSEIFSAEVDSRAQITKAIHGGRLMPSESILFLSLVAPSEWFDFLGIQVLIEVKRPTFLRYLRRL